MRKEEVQWDTVELVHLRDQPFEPPEKGVLKHNQRLLLPNVRTRTLLTQFCKKQPEALPEAGWKELLASLERECPPLFMQLHDLHNTEERRCYPLPITTYTFTGAWK